LLSGGSNLFVGMGIHLRYLKHASGSPQRDRYQLVQQLESRGICDKAVLNAMRKTPRHLFISNALWDSAYADHPVPIDENQTISQPYIVALMTQALNVQKNEKILEIGTGSGYQTAILAELAGAVYTIERYATLSHKARTLLESAGYHHIFYHVGDGSLGWPEPLNFDKIIATAACPQLPPMLLGQLKEGGRLVLPVGPRRFQSLLLVHKEHQQLRQEELCQCSFLPLIGKEGWSETEFIAN